MCHREVDPAGAARLRPLRDASAQRHGRLRPAGDLDVPPCKSAGDAEAERLTDGFLARKPARVALRGVRARLAVGLLGRREAAVAEPRVALERAPDAVDLDQVDADVHECSSSQSGSCAIDEMIPSGRMRDASTASGRNLPVRTRTDRIPCRCAPAMSDSMSSPTIQVIPASASSSLSAASKYAVDGLPSTVASTCVAYSRPATNAPASSAGPCFVCHQRFLCRQ